MKFKILIFIFIFFVYVSYIISIDDVILDDNVYNISNGLDVVDNIQTDRFILASSSDLPISYSISNNCSDYMKYRIRDAFLELFSETNSILFFIEVPSGGNIDINCSISNSLSFYDIGGTYTAGEAYVGVGGYFINNSIDFYNLKSRAETYMMGACSKYPDTEIHEILHVFGFKHNLDEGSIMGPSSTGCDVISIDKYIIDCLKYTYSDGKYGNDCSSNDKIKKLEDVEYECADGWYNTLNTDGCCPEPNMYVDSDGNCVS